MHLLIVFSLFLPNNGIKVYQIDFFSSVNMKFSTKVLCFLATHCYSFKIYNFQLLPFSIFQALPSRGSKWGRSCALCHLVVRVLCPHHLALSQNEFFWKRSFFFFLTLIMSSQHIPLICDLLTERATSGSLQSEDWALNMEICDIINETEEG